MIRNEKFIKIENHPNNKYSVNQWVQYYADATEINSNRSGVTEKAVKSQ